MLLPLLLLVLMINIVNSYNNNHYQYKYNNNHLSILKYKNINNNMKKNDNIMILMAQSGGRGGGGGSTKLDKKTIQETALKPTYKDNIEKDYRLILHDDTVHTIQQVCEIVGSIGPLCSGPRAYEVTLEVHMTGAGTVCVANKKIVSEYCKSLQQAGLTVSMAPDDEFESGDDLE